jgi:hypothetical protein
MRRYKSIGAQPQHNGVKIILRSNFLLPVRLEDSDRAERLLTNKISVLKWFMSFDGLRRWRLANLDLSQGIYSEVRQAFWNCWPSLSVPKLKPTD